MNYSNYYQARDKVIEIMRKDLLGPVTSDEVITNELPNDYYILGKLYPRGSMTKYYMFAQADDLGELDDEDLMGLNNGKMPSSCGLSISTNKDVDSILIKVRCAKYLLEEIYDKDIEDKKVINRRLWKRSPIETDWIRIKLKDLLIGKSISELVDAYLDLSIILHKTYEDGTKTITVSLINQYEEFRSRYEENQYTYFQPEIIITSEKTDAFVDVRKNVQISKDKELQNLNMLYSDEKTYASGHGCAVKDYVVDGQRYITTDFFPQYELLQMMPLIDNKSDILSMSYLCSSEKRIIINNLHDWMSNYQRWIESLKNKLKGIEKGYKDSAEQNISNCEQTYNRIMKSIECLQDDLVFQAFQYANRAMLMQRKQMLSNHGSVVNDREITWYPFQLAFFLQEIISFADPKNDERKKVDLLWFPTGGGKTEAYLGISAFVIFLRRLRYGSDGDGVTVLMRYTLRLLTFQQFERASAMICACEQIRLSEGIPGGEINIGLWAGKALTPNKIEMAERILKGESDPQSESSNPKQFDKCPWCGSKLTEENYHCDRHKQRMLICCSNNECSFRRGLPVYLIDEEIYRYRPSYIVATVDKFAQVPFKEDTFNLFGQGFLPPELIIQDELHLISGPLGTVTGIYEAAFKRMCEYKGVPAKVIASTATIRNADEQIKALYATDYTQFPPQGISANDSFFAIKSNRLEKPSRLYMGCMATGTSPITMMVRVMSSLLFSTRYLTMEGYSDEVIDSFWTITGYFNTLRELGGAIIRVVDNIQDRFKYLRDNKFKDIYSISGGQDRYDRYKELTSREKSENIGSIIQNDLQEKYSSDGTTAPYDFLLSSNMISVGVDIARLGTMIVVGQPKSTAEYIQATSRVGRETPGLVITTYNQERSRDRSHYEQFYSYHSAFYKYVEATSVTPFSDRARDRALQTLYVMLCRYYIPELSGDNDAIKFRKSMPGLENVRKYILDYVRIVDPEEYSSVSREINEIEEEWEIRARNSETLKYHGTIYENEEKSLFDDDSNEISRFRALNSMRSVETHIDVVVRE